MYIKPTINRISYIHTHTHIYIHIYISQLCNIFMGRGVPESPFRQTPPSITGGDGEDPRCRGQGPVEEGGAQMDLFRHGARVHRDVLDIFDPTKTMGFTWANLGKPHSF